MNNLYQQASPFGDKRQFVGINPKPLKVSEIFGETTTLRSTLSATGGKVVPYALAAYAWRKTTISIFSDDPVKRAEQRGYTLK